MFFQAKNGNASNGVQFQVPDAKLRRLTVFFIVYNIFIKMNILSAGSLGKYFLLFTIRYMTAKINKDKRCPTFKNK